MLPKKLVSLASSCRSGNVAIATALLMPVMVLTTMGGVSISMVMSQRQELVDMAQLACTRAVKPTRMKILTDADRTARALTLFDQMATERGFQIKSRAVTSDWLTAHVEAVAHVPAIANMSTDQVPSFDIAASVDCNGLPPFPKVGDTLLSSNFQRPDGSKLPMKYGVWGVYKPTEFGWEGGSGPGVEIQDWISGPWLGTLPPGSTNPYVVELDSDEGPSWNRGNSSMYRTVELHKGTYRFSFWYFGRQPDPETNRISVYLEGTRPVSPKVQKLTIAKPRSDGWTYASFDIPVTTYSLYRITIAAEGADDTTGGNFNDLRLEYLKRPGDK